LWSCLYLALADPDLYSTGAHCCSFCFHWSCLYLVLADPDLYSTGAHRCSFCFHLASSSVILAGTLYLYCLAPLLFNVIRVILILHVMHVSSAITRGCLFILHHRILLDPLILFIVIYGPRPFLVSLVTNTIWSFLMILSIICGLFHCV
jgi:hypothetical protein